MYILKRSGDCLLCTKKEASSVLFIRKNMAVKAYLSPCSRSLFITFTVRVTKQHHVNISFLKKLEQRIIEAQSVLPC